MPGLQAAPSVDLDLFELLPSTPEGWAKTRIPSPLERLQLRIAVRQPNLRHFEHTLLDLSDPSHPNYGQHLTRGNLKSLLRPSAETTDAILFWMATGGVPDPDIENDGDWINFHANVSQVEKLLNTRFFYYRNSATGTDRLRTLKYSVPRQLHQHIVMIQPTTRFDQMRAERSTIYEQRVIGEVGWTGRHRLTNTSSCSTINPACIRQLYNIGSFKAEYHKKNTIGICGYLGEIAMYDDLNTFLQKYAPEAAPDNFTLVSINGGLTTQGPTAYDSTEANLDVQYALSVSYPAPGVFYSTGGRGQLVPDLDQPDLTTGANEPYLDLLHYLIKLPDSDLPKVLTTSYGEDEQSVPQSYARTTCNMFAQLGARGVSVIFSSGDSGPGSACQTNDGRNTTRFSPMFPASCPWVTTVGGTYNIQPERAKSFSGGGFSDYFCRPKYQDFAVQRYLTSLGDRWKGLYNPNGRGYPDVAAQSVNYSMVDSGKQMLVDGTSAAAPTFAAIISLLNSARLSSNLPPLGFLNPWIYSVGGLGFSDILEGGSKGCLGTDTYSGLKTPIVPFASWNATAGWDPVTGYGTPDFGKLLKLSTPSYRT
ncbi:MAG: vesicle formation at the endoplasmic reticulum [Candelina mexicana]|nr:MAG: vesicle formation at the endoplasmic reticulum [Candelina mexicana]